MTVSLHLSEEVLARLRAEASRRGIAVEELIAELAAQLPGGDLDTASREGRLLSFSGVGASGTREPIGRRHREIIAESLADKRASEM